MLQQIQTKKVRTLSAPFFYVIIWLTIVLYSTILYGVLNHNIYSKERGKKREAVNPSELRI